MILFFIVSAFLSVAVAQQPSLNCSYFRFGTTYGCELIANNPNGFNNFTEIGGIHLEGFTNLDVGLLFTFSGVTTNVPSIICETFSNIVHIELYNIGLTEITDTSLSGCSQLAELWLDWNRISSVSENAFVNLRQIDYLNLEHNLLTTLPENVFADQQLLTTLDITNNPFEDIPSGLFRPLESLEILYLGYANIATINNQWFTSNSRLYYLYLSNNRINVSADSFVGLERLQVLNLGYNGINEIPTEAFTPLSNLQGLYLNGNSFSEVPANSFEGLGTLEHLDISDNPIRDIHNGAFRGLVNLTALFLIACRLQRLNSNSFEDLGNLYYVYMNLNQIEELPQGVFAPTPNLNFIGLWSNRLKSLHRNRFGTLINLGTLDLDGNVVNALDREIIDDAVNLNTLYFSGNLCASNFFGNFLISRPQHLPVLERCFSNMRYIIDTTTEGDDEFSFFDGPQTGIAVRVNTNNEVQIALTPFSFLWNPSVEIFIGTSNNTQSIIRINQETNVATIPTPNILARDQWNDFRITWENQVILVFSGNSTFPFMAYTMQHFVPVNFYGLRAVETRALWTVQPFYW